MSDSVSKYYDDLEDKQHWENIAREEEKKSNQTRLVKLFNWITSLVKF